MIHFHRWTILDGDDKTNTFYCLKCKEVKVFTKDSNFIKPKGKVEFLPDATEQELEDLRKPLWARFFNKFK